MLQGETLNALITEYVIHYSAIRGFSGRTIDNKRTLFQRLTTFLREQPLDLEHTQDYINHLNSKQVQAYSIKTIVANIKSFIHWIIRKKKVIMEDWTIDIEIPKVHYQPEMLPTTFQAEEAIIAGTEPGKMTT